MISKRRQSDKSPHEPTNPHELKKRRWSDNTQKQVKICLHSPHGYLQLQKPPWTHKPPWTQNKKMERQHLKASRRSASIAPMATFNCKSPHEPKLKAEGQQSKRGEWDTNLPNQQSTSMAPVAGPPCPYPHLGRKIKIEKRKISKWDIDSLIIRHFRRYPCISPLQ